MPSLTPASPTRSNDKKNIALFAFASFSMLFLAVAFVRLADMESSGKVNAGYVQLGTTGLVIFAAFITLLTTRFIYNKKKEVIDGKKDGGGNPQEPINVV